MAAIPPIPPIPHIPVPGDGEPVTQSPFIGGFVAEFPPVPGIPPFPVVSADVDLSTEIADCTLPDVEAQQSANDQSDQNSIADLVARLANNNDKPKRASTSRRQTESTSDSEEGGQGLTATGRVRQHRRSRRVVDEDRLYDGTQLHASHHGYFVHRDYAAHFFRWSAVINRMKPGMRVLDVGSGQDLPLPRVISAPNIFKNVEPEQVVCVDWNPLSESFNPKWLQKIGEFDFCKRYPELIGSIGQDGKFFEMPQYKFDIIVNLEVIEHMDQNSGDELLQGVRACLKDDGEFLLSTPVFNGSAAANHIYEYGALELFEKLKANGFLVTERFGTFANLTDLRKVMTEDEKELAKKLGEFYNNDVISCMFAPKYPDAARNNFWVCVKDPNWVPNPMIEAQAYAIPEIVINAPSPVVLGIETQEPDFPVAPTITASTPPIPSVPYQGQGIPVYDDQGILIGETHVDPATANTVSVPIAAAPAIPAIPAVPAIPAIPPIPNA